MQSIGEKRPINNSPEGNLKIFKNTDKQLSENRTLELPNEMIHHIFSFLIPDSYSITSDKVIQFSLVSKQWKEVMDGYLVELKPAYSLGQIALNILGGTLKDRKGNKIAIPQKTVSDLEYIVYNINANLENIENDPTEIFRSMKEIYRYLFLIEEFLNNKKRRKRIPLTKENCEEASRDLGVIFDGKQIIVNKNIGKNGCRADTLSKAITRDMSLQAIRMINNRGGVILYQNMPKILKRKDIAQVLPLFSNYLKNEMASVSIFQKIPFDSLNDEDFKVMVNLAFECLPTFKDHFLSIEEAIGNKEIFINKLLNFKKPRQ